MRVIDKPITIVELREIAKTRFGNFVKAVVDINREIMVIDAELHADEEAKLLEMGSKQQNLWGINLYPDLNRSERIEYDSMINVRPSQGNLSRSISDAKIRNKIVRIVTKLII